MFTIIIQEKGGDQRRMVFNKPEVTIGRVQGNDIVLAKGNVSKRHARIVLKDGKFIIVDLKSTNGTYVNGRKITSPLVVKDSDKIYIGDFIVGVDEAAAGDADNASETTTSPPGGDRPVAPVDVRPPRPTEAAPMPAMAVTTAPEPSLPAPAPPAPAPPAVAPRSGPPRPAPLPGRDPASPTGAPPLRGEPAIPPLAGPTGRPLGARTLGGAAGSTGLGGASGAPTGAGLGGGAGPGATLPPPIAPIPAAMAPSPLATHSDPLPSLGTPASSQPITARPDGHAPSGPMHAAPSALGNGAGMGAPVVPLTADKSKRALVGAGARRVVGRSVAAPTRKPVQLDPLDPKVVKMLDLQATILERLRAKLDLDKIPIERLHEDELWQRAERATIDLVEALETSGELPKYIDQDTLIKETLSEALALGPLEELLADDKIDEILIDRRDRVVVGKGGVLRGSGRAFSSDEVFERVVKRLVAEAGGEISETLPLVDLRMRDGTRVTAAVPPVAARGACLVLKKSPPQSPPLTDLVAQGALSAGMADFLGTCIAARRNILVCGGPGSGKTALVGALAAASPRGERVVSIEEIAELALPREEWVQLETRAATGRAPGVDLAHLLETALRLAPDRLVVGEVRGREALPLVSALCTSVDGAVVAMTGEGASAALGRLIALVRATTPGGSDSAVRELVAQAFEIVVHVVRWSDGSTRVLAIDEVVGCTDSAFETHVLFQFHAGSFGATGTVPRFYSELEARGIAADQAVFR
jgi:pilus assembly protein CpaF